MKKRWLPFVKAAVLLCAAVTVIFRFLLSKYAEVLPQEAVRPLRVISLVSAALLLVFGLVWALAERTGKKGKER